MGGLRHLEHESRQESHHFCLCTSGRVVFRPSITCHIRSSVIDDDDGDDDDDDNDDDDMNDDVDDDDDDDQSPYLDDELSHGVAVGHVHRHRARHAVLHMTSDHHDHDDENKDDDDDDDDDGMATTMMAMIDVISSSSSPSYHQHDHYDVTGPSRFAEDSLKIRRRFAQDSLNSLKIHRNSLNTRQRFAEDSLARTLCCSTRMEGRMTCTVMGAG
jgi:hypothetical protein